MKAPFSDLDGKISNMGCFYLSQLKYLTNLNVFNNNISDAGVAKLLRNTVKANFVFRNYSFI